MATIVKAIAREVFDSRGDPTLEVDVVLSSGAMGSTIVPSGASVGKYEAVELRDKDPKRFKGKGVLSAVRSVSETIAPHLVGRDPLDQVGIDRMLIELDGTETKSKLGANAILGVSLSVAKAAAADLALPLYRYIGGAVGRELPLPLFAMISGGRHAGENIDFQDFQIVPLVAKSFGEALRVGKDVHVALNDVLRDKGLATGVSDTGGYPPVLESNAQALELMEEAVERAGYEAGADVAFSMDVAAEMFYQDGRYILKAEGKELGSEQMVDLLESWVESYPIVLIEDPLGEDDFDGWKLITRRLGGRVQLIGDDLFTTNMRRFAHGAAQGIANGILVKPNQIGTLTETLDIIAAAKTAGYWVVISRRSGETEDTTVADLAVATNCEEIKFGSFSRSEGLAKYNRLLRIEESLGAAAIYRGKTVLERPRC